MSLVSVADLRTYLGDEKTGNTAVLQAVLDAADLTMFKGCRRQFVIASGPATARVYAPRGVTDLQRIHDCTTVTAVTNDGVAVAAVTGYQLEPLNGLTLDGEARPYDGIRLLYGSCWEYDGGRATVSVTATWGWLAIPVPITEAIKAIAKDICGNKDIKHGIVKMTEVGAVSARQNQYVRDVIRDYRREEAKAGVGGR